MFCKNCGLEIDGDSKFCAKCGSIIETPESNQNEKVFEQTENAENVEKSSVVSPEKIFPKKVQKIITIVIAVILLGITVISVALTANSSEKKMQQALNTHNSYEVNSLYNDAYGDAKKIEKYDNAISDFLDEVISGLNNKEYSNEDLAQNGYTVVYRDLTSDWGNLIYSEDGDTMQTSISYHNRGKWEQMENIIKSRASYCSAIAYRDNNKQPIEAIKSFKQVIEEDSFHTKVDDEIAKCVDLYVEQTLVEAQKMLDSNDIDTAMQKIDSINSYLEENGLTSDTIQKKLTEIKEKYAQQYIAKAKECFNNKDINGAIGNVDVALKLQPDNADYISKKETYKQYLPLALYISDNCLNVDETGDFMGTLAFDQNEEANNNKKMVHSVIWYNNNDDSSTSLNAYYNLEGKYDVVAGTFFLPKDEKDTQLKGWFKVYGDGKLLYTSKKMTGGVLPQKFSVKVKSVHKLKISFFAEGTGGFLSNSSHMGISNLTAKKNFPQKKG